MSAVLDNLDVFWSGFRITLLLTLLSSALALTLGTLLAAFRVAPVPVLRAVGGGYVETVRNVPAIVVFFFVLFGLPQIGVQLSFMTSAVTALTVYYAAFFCEAVRSGINAVPVGQAEAARSVGLTFGASLRLVILPQALRSVIPPLINVFIALAKTSAVASAFGVAELLNAMQRLANSESASIIAILLTTALLYLVITIPAGLIAHRIERKVAILR
ncbi:amino acid ABC transporter permease [Streptomyces sp. P17]|uniref:amino acid ABC transporter permease n=1 Tax=Streptomyces sp. P17 TaxID=3074716 RepID=UPI0028F41E7C|nr:amino acid ABC transporter permease [Streptomyces sp. P17]MDT9697952.1 amino acid ABC transporter permease [Streptomyces sp. P17]